MKNELIDLTGGSQDKNIKDMAEIQNEGISMAQNILKEKDYDYVMISDDVGLGKTYEALGIIFQCILELEQRNEEDKKYGNFLIIAPSTNVAYKWLREIDEFICKKLNKKLIIQIDKADKDYSLKLAEGKLVNIQIDKDYINNPLKLAKGKLGNNKHSISVIRANKFSYIDEKTKEYEQYIKKNNLKNETVDINQKRDIEIHLKNQYIKELEEKNKKLPVFDLVVIDESQNLRLKDSKKVKYLNTFFGLHRFDEKKHEKNSKMKFKKTIFLTATPNHSKKQDIVEQIDFVKNSIDINKIKVISKQDEIKKEDNVELYIIRRIRQFEHKNKYFYRKFIGENADMNFLERLTMATIQKKQINEKNLIKMGYLDGFEGFLKKEELKNKKKEDKWDQNDEMNDLDKADDETYKIDGLFQKLKDYTKDNETIKLNEILSHPKVRKIQNLLKDYYEKENEQSNIDKDLIFVRRKSSIDEIRKAYLNVFDQEITEMVAQMFELKENDTKKIISNLEKKYKKKEDIKEENEYKENEDDNTNEEWEETESSIWLDELKRKKDTDYQSFLYKAKRDFTNYYTFDRIWEENIFSELGLQLKKIEVNKKNVLCFKYSNKKILIEEKRILDLICSKKISISQNANSYNIKRYDWIKLINLAILEKLNKENDIKDYIKNEYEKLYFEEESEKNKKEKEEKRKNININWNIIKGYFSIENKSFWDLKELNIYMKKFSNPREIHKEQFLEREVKKEIIKANMLNGEGIIYLISIVAILGSDKIEFTDIFEKIEKDNISKFKKRIMNRIIEFLENFEIENKMLDYKNFDSKKLLEFKNAHKYYYLPIAGCSSSEKYIERAQKFFNTSFYPDILVTTDILKEGIDLQVFCSRIIHYGIAWLPGDMEQRIGRIDRYFCNTYREIIKNKDKKIEVVFVYMDDIMDKKQVTKIISNMITSIKELDKDFVDVNFSKKINKECDIIEDIDAVNENIKIINDVMMGKKT